MNVRTLDPSYIRRCIPARKKDSHKGSYGHVLILAGSRGMTGAGALCALGALRSGAGLVTVAVPDSQEAALISRLRPEVMTLPLPENASGFLIPGAADKVLAYIRERKVTSLCVGPGLGNTTEAGVVVRKLLASVPVPVVLDADGLNTITENDIARSEADLIITPHPGEFSRLTGVPVKEIQRGRGKYAGTFAKKNGLICVLKGYRTVIADGAHTFVNPTGNAGMATGGSGDILSGMIAALIPQVTPPAPLTAALCGVFLHGTAGDIAAREKSQIGMIAGDIAEHLPAALRHIAVQKTRRHHS